jgi:hypothetical protein
MNAPTSPARLIRAAAVALSLAVALGTTTVARAADSELARYQAAATLAAQHVATFDTLDFDVFTNQKRDRIKEPFCGHRGALARRARHERR